MRNIFKHELAFFDKKYWIPVTSLCNNNCIFCLMGARENTHHRTFEEIKNELDSVEDKKNTRLVVSGGEPTIHPKIIEIIHYAKNIGFRRSQIVTNGRFFAYKSFTDKIIDAGLSETTFSIHGHTPELHDVLTQSKGAFEQAMAGVKNVLAHKKVIINVDVVITKQNYLYLEEIVTFLMNKGFGELNLHSIMPFGNAYDNLEHIDYDFEKITPYVHKAINACKKRGAVLWMSRFPPQYLYNHEDVITDSYKIFDHDLKPHIKNFRDGVTPSCKGKRCKHCSINIFCDVLVSQNERVLKKEHFDSIKINFDDKTDSKKVINKINISKEFLPDKIVFESNAAHGMVLDAISYVRNKGFKQIQYNTTQELSTQQIDKLTFAGITELKITSEDLKIFEKIMYETKPTIPVLFKIIVTKQNYGLIKYASKRFSKIKPQKIILSLVEPRGMLYKDYAPVVEELPKIMPFLESFIKDVRKNIEIENIPPCFLNENSRKLLKKEVGLDLEDLTEKGELDLLNFSRKNILGVKIKGLQCKSCVFDKNCAGIFQKYIRLYGFKQLKPVQCPQT